MKTQRPEDFEFAMSFLGGKEEDSILSYIESLEKDASRYRYLRTEEGNCTAREDYSTPEEFDASVDWSIARLAEKTNVAEALKVGQQTVNLPSSDKQVLALPATPSTCSTCKWWQKENIFDRIANRLDATYPRDAPTHELRFCMNDSVYLGQYHGPSLRSCISGIDPDYSYITTGPDFGCIHHEA